MSPYILSTDNRQEEIRTNIVSLKWSTKYTLTSPFNLIEIGRLSKASITFEEILCTVINICINKQSTSYTILSC